MVEGWKAFFKFTIWMLKKHEKEMLNMAYDKIMPMLGNIQKSGFFMGAGEIAGARQEIQRIKVTRSLLEQLANEYKCFEVNVKKIMGRS